MTRNVVPEVAALLTAGRHGDAARLLIGAAAGGEAAAIALLAQWRVSGDIVRRDLAAARELFRRAAGAGDAAAALLHAFFLASGTGGDANWAAAFSALKTLRGRHPAAAAQLALLERMNLDAGGFPRTPPRRQRLSERPFAVAAPGFATPAECDYLIRAGEASLQPSMVVDPATGRLIPHPVRSSDGMTFGVYAEDLVVNALNRRIAALSGTLPEQGEPLQLLRYRPGDEYRAHVDALPAEPNQRIITVLVYLSDGYAGGETRFLRTDLSFRGKKGDALLFRNVTEAGDPDQMAVHAGLPVTKGVKIIASRWIRERPFTYPPPRPRLDL